MGCRQLRRWSRKPAGLRFIPDRREAWRVLLATTLPQTEGCVRSGHRVALFYTWSRLCAMQKLKQLREERGWTIYEVARRAQISFQSIANLEGSTDHPSPGNPAKTTITTVNALLELFHPDLKLCDFVENTDLKAVPRSAYAKLRIQSKSQ